MRARPESDHGDRFAGVTRYRVHECMQELGIRGICPNAPKTTTKPSEDAGTRPDLVRRDFTSPVPTHRLVGDITYLRTTCGLTCLAVAIDLATRVVAGWGIRDDMRAGLVAGAIEMAWARGYVAEGGIFHSDRGSQYTSSLFSKWADSHDVRLSVGRTGSCHDNAVAESFFGTLKNEWFASEAGLLDPATTKNLAIQFIESYHDRYRPHEAIDDRVPAELMDEFFVRPDAALDRDPAYDEAA